MATDALIGIDLGTSGLKAAVAAADGTVLGQAEAAYPVRSPHAGWAETDPEEWWRAAVLAISQAWAEARTAGPVRPAGLAAVGQMHGLVLAAADGAPVRPALLWPEQRAEGDVAQWAGLAGGVRTRLANPLVPGMAGPMLHWLAANEPSALARARWAMQPKDWLRLRLTGTAATDPSDASATLLWDIPADTWSDPAVHAARIAPGLLPPVLPSAEPAGELASAAAHALGLEPGAPVAAGAGDTAAALLASGLDRGRVQITVGTGAQITAYTSDPAPAAGTHVYRSAEESGWYRMAAVANAGLALDWVRGLLGASWAEFTAGCASGEPGAGGVGFTPLLVRERLLDAGAGGALTGLRLHAGRPEILRAAAEGVAFAVRSSAELLPGGLDGPVRVAGGVGRDPAFAQLLADVLGVELRPVRQRSASALGAVFLAARAAGLPDPALPRTEGGLVVPGADSGAYSELYARRS